MTERDLKALSYITKRIKDIEERIAELENEIGVGAVNMDGMPHGSTPGNPVERLAIAKAALHEQLVTLKATLLEKELEIRQYIESVDQEDVKLIMEMRFIKFMDWYNIACELEDLTGKAIERTTPAKRMKKYIREHAEVS